MNKAYFFKRVRENLFAGRLSKTQVDGMERILDYRADHYPNMSDDELAYVLATAKHETAHTMQPVSERGGNSYFFRMYDPQGSRPDVARRLGNTQPGDGVLFKGRGLPQLTGRANYRKFGYEDNPEAVLEWPAALDVMFRGMILGKFTGKKLSDYIGGGRRDYIGARAIINGSDKAKQIALIASGFREALEQAKGTGSVPENEPQTTGKPLLQSKTVLIEAAKWALPTGLGGLGFLSSIPWQNLAVVGAIALAGLSLWTVYERWKKSVEEGV